MNQNLIPSNSLNLIHQNPSLSPNIQQYRLCHVDRYILAQKIIERRIQNAKGEQNSPLTLFRSKIKSEIERHTIGTELKKQIRKKLNYEQNVFLSEVPRKNSFPRHNLNNSYRITSKNSKRYSTQASNYKQFRSVSHMQTICKEDDDIYSPEQLEQSLKRQWKNSLFRRDQPSPQLLNCVSNSDGIKRRQSNKKMTINEHVDMINSQKRKYQFGKLSRVGMIPKILRFQRNRQLRRQKMLIDRVDQKVYSYYKLQAHHQAMHF